MYQFFECSILPSFLGGLCDEICVSGKSCRQFGQYLCLCEKGKSGANCEEQGTFSKFFSSFVIFIGRSSPHFCNLKLNFHLTLGMQTAHKTNTQVYLCMFDGLIGGSHNHQ